MPSYALCCQRFLSCQGYINCPTIFFNKEKTLLEYEKKRVQHNKHLVSLIQKGQKHTS